MYGIGTVARLAQVSVRTLRHYDDLGLLTPAHVDPVTGYRRYRPDQVLMLHRILVLRDLGVPLSEIGQLIDDDVTVDQLRGILRLRQAESRARLATQTEQLTRVEVRPSILRESDGPMLIVGLQDAHGQFIGLPRRPAERPDPIRLERRYERFVRAS